MRVDVSLKYLEKSEFIDNILDKNVKKIERRIKLFHKDVPIHLSVHVEKNPHREQYFCRNHIYLPSKLIKAEERGNNISLAVNRAFSALSKQLDKLKYKVEKHLQRHKKESLEPEETLDQAL